jgi:tetratricopeptide (TPR) repeat protein
MMEQVPLFLDEFVLLNDAATALGELRLVDADALLNDYANLYSGNREEVKEKLRVVAFLRERLDSLPASGTELPDLLFQVWRSFESFCGSLACNPRLPETLRFRFFGKIIAAIEDAALSANCLLNENIPIGYVYMEAGQYEQAVRSLQSCLLLDHDNATNFGYLGDAWWGRGRQETARQIYFEACLIDPYAIDWRHLRDEELKNLLDLLVDEYNWEPSLACEWLPAYAYIRGIFKPKMIRMLEEFSVFTEKYRKLQKAFRANSDSAYAARLFTKGLVLCDNEPFLRNVRGMDFADIRREMKSVSPVLFAEYMKGLKQRRL